MTQNKNMETTEYTKPKKPLGQRAYGSIPHLPGSRRGPADKGLSDQQARILTEKGRDKHDIIIVEEKLDALLNEGERCVGEWLMEAHGTLYKLPHEPFVIFDIITGYVRSLSAPMKARCAAQNFVTPRVLHVGEPISIEKVLTMLEPSGHGAIDGVEGAVWRVERKGVVDFLGKYVRPDKVDGKYLETISGNAPIYNWTPAMLANADVSDRRDNPKR